MRYFIFSRTIITNRNPEIPVILEEDYRGHSTSDFQLELLVSNRLASCLKDQGIDINPQLITGSFLFENDCQVGYLNQSSYQSSSDTTIWVQIWGSTCAESLLSIIGKDKITP